MSTIGERIAEARQRRGWTQSDLAARAGSSAATVSQWETGHRTPGAPALVALADALEVTADWLLGRGD